MRRLIWILVLGVGAIAVAGSGCGGSRQEVRVDSSLTNGSTQGKLDNVAANFLSGLIGGTH